MCMLSREVREMDKWLKVEFCDDGSVFVKVISGEEMEKVIEEGDVVKVNEGEYKKEGIESGFVYYGGSEIIIEK